MQGIAQGQANSSSAYVKLAFQLSTGGPAVGTAFALCLAVWLKSWRRRSNGSFEHDSNCSTQQLQGLSPQP